MEASIPASQRKILDKWMSTLPSDKLLEVEGRIVSSVSKEQFSKCIRCLVKKGWKVESLPEMLDIATGNDVRTTITSPEDIARYSNGKDPQNVRVIKKVRTESPVELTHFGVRINAKTETPVEADQKVSHMSSLSELAKTFRLKKRFQLVPSGEGTPYHADFSVVKSGSSVRRLPDARSTYEIELEAHPGATTSVFLDGLKAILTCLDDGFEPISQIEKDAVLSDYLSLTFPSVSLSVAKGSPKRYFAGPQPVTLTLEHLLPPEPGRLSILKDYTVTDKADGERSMLFTRDGHAYLINNRLQVRALPAAASVPGCLVDGEWIELADDQRMFAAFDIYLRDRKDVRGLPLMAPGESPSRVRLMDSVVKGVTPVEKSRLTLMVKTFRQGEDAELLQACDVTLRSHKAGNTPYRIDGLIFTPKSLAVSASGPGPAPSSWGGAWTRVLKWKPPEDNTIDFLVSFGELIVKEGRSYRITILHVGYNASWEPKTALSVLGGAAKPADRRGTSFVAKPFQPEDADDAPRIFEAFLPVDANGKVACVNGEVVETDTVVEFAYSGQLNKEPFSSYKWVPVRIRHDKSQEFRITGIVSANSYKTALNVWQSMIQPVTEALITGQEALDIKQVDGRDVYYAKITGRDVSATQNMRHFHNNWVKMRTCLLPLKEMGSKSLLDLACGKGGDLWKWADAGLANVIGLDLFADNINNADDGAYARLSRMRLPSGTRYVFAPYDVSKPIDAAHINRVDDEGDRMVLQTLWAVVPKQMIRAKGLLQYYGMAVDRFDVVSCQFAIHYFFKDDETLDNFTRNVVRNLRPGGRFVGTCLDGARLATKLARVPQGSHLQGTTDTGEVIWSIRKMYADADADKEVGRGIAVYFESIDTTNVEFLVDYNVLKDRFSNLGLVPVAHAGFEELYASMMAYEPTSAGEAASIKKASEMTAAEKEWSFMNMWFAFEKPPEQGAATRKSRTTPVKTLNAV